MLGFLTVCDIFGFKPLLDTLLLLGFCSNLVAKALREGAFSTFWLVFESEVVFFMLKDELLLGNGSDLVPRPCEEVIFWPILVADGFPKEFTLVAVVLLLWTSIGKVFVKFRDVVARL